ncbi:MAG: hypothetical protein N4A71_25980 [Carboxylicivirga sp.]|jgi:hypothetical protein|nr:hypothetical protein [Carboxylicivirga sp.]MCT4647371.1 hypothetical protein [Carboxylicivirga sp.]
MNTDSSYLTLLENQLKQIDERDFDFNSWKKATVLLTSSCFGANSAQVDALQKIDYAYSSWTLRDEQGTTDPIKNECRTTLLTIINEFKIKLDNDSSDNSKAEVNNLNFLWLTLEDELTGASLKKLKSLLTQANVSSDEVETFLKELPSQTLVNIILNSLLSKEFKTWISQ